jgi:hypothetical protein
VQLKRAKLQHGKIFRFHFRHFVEQGSADVAAEKNGVSGFAQKCGDYSGGGGFAVAAGYGYRAAGAHGEKRLHFGGENAAARNRLLKLGSKRVQPRSAKNNVLVKAVKILFAKAQFNAGFAQCRGLFKHVFGTLVANGNVKPAVYKKLCQRRVGNAVTYDGNAFALKRSEVFVQSHGKNHLSENTLYIIFLIFTICIGLKRRVCTAEKLTVIITKTIEIFYALC